MICEWKEITIFNTNEILRVWKTEETLPFSDQIEDFCNWLPKRLKRCWSTRDPVELYKVSVPNKKILFLSDWACKKF